MQNTQKFTHLTKPKDSIPKKNSYSNKNNILRILTINVNGIRASVKKGLFDYLIDSQADIICMQETRISDKDWFGKFELDGYHAHLFTAQKKGYAGVAIYSKLPINQIKTGLGFDIADTQGRYIEGEFVIPQLDKPLYVASLYLPSGSSGDDAQARKDIFLNQYKAILQDWRKNDKSIIVCGDYNMVHKKIDIKNFVGNQKSSGCLPHERAWLDEIYNQADPNLGYVDSFRVVRKDEFIYSWWSNRGQARNNNVGWRIDYQVCSPDWQNRVVGAWVYRDVFFSDHAPVIIDYDLTK